MSAPDPVKARETQIANGIRRIAAGLMVADTPVRKAILGARLLGEAEFAAAIFGILEGIAQGVEEGGCK